ncbi:MAG: ABC transporter ATP-binding protein [Verrucomicrobiota bacterium]
MISVRNIRIRRSRTVLPAVSFEIPCGSYAVFMGPTGCGKTSILECIAGLTPAASGEILVDGRDVTALPARDRRIGYVPQDAALFTGMDVRANLGFSLHIRGEKKTAVARRVTEVSEMLGIGHLLTRTVKHLSGGERQRVALGRALAFHPKVLLLDEPLSALDETTRNEMCALLSSVNRSTGTTVLHVTHSAQEAGQLADLRLDADTLFENDPSQQRLAPQDGS